MLLTHYIDQRTVANTNDFVQMKLEVLNAFYDASVICDLWHLRIVLLLEILQRIPLDVKVTKRLPMHVGWCDFPHNLVIVSCHFRSDRDALHGFL